MTDKLIEKAKFVQQLFRECDAIQLPHKPTEEVLTGLIDRILADAKVIKAAEELAEALDKYGRSGTASLICWDDVMDARRTFNRAKQGRKGGE